MQLFLGHFPLKSAYSVHRMFELYSFSSSIPICFMSFKFVITICTSFSFQPCSLSSLQLDHIEYSVKLRPIGISRRCLHDNAS